MEKRIKRLEIAVVVLGLLLALSVGASIYSAMQIKAMANSLPSYKEIKEDIKTLNNLYKISEVQVPKAYHYASEKVIESSVYAKAKTNELINYIKEKTNDK